MNIQDKLYKIKKLGDGKSPHLLVNSDDENDILALCSCGKTKDQNFLCDGSHKNQEGDSSCCGGGCCSN